MQKHNIFYYLFEQPVEAVVKSSGLVLGVEQNRIVQLEGTYSNPLVQLPAHFRADQKLKQTIK